MLNSLLISIALTTTPSADASELTPLPIELEEVVHAQSKKSKAKKSKTTSAKDKKKKKGAKKSNTKKPQDKNSDEAARDRQSRDHERPDGARDGGGQGSDARNGNGHPHAHDVHGERPADDLTLRPALGNTPHSQPEHRPATRGEAQHVRPTQGNETPAATAHQANQTRDARTGRANAAHAQGGGHVRPGDQKSPPATRPHHGHTRPHQAKHHWRPHRYRPVPVRLSWSLGWFVHPHYAVSGGSTNTGSVATLNRKVDRYDTFSAGAKIGSTLGAYKGVADSTYSDAGIGVYGRYRLAEPIGLEIAYTYSSSTDSSEALRYSHTLQPSVQLFLFPWTRVSPYGTLGLTFDTAYDADRGTAGQSQAVKDSAWGAHAGVGIEFAIGDNVALDLEARGIQFVEGHPDTLDHQIQTSAGLSWYF